MALREELMIFEAWRNAYITSDAISERDYERAIKAADLLRNERFVCEIVWLEMIRLSNSFLEKQMYEEWEDLQKV